MMVHVSRGIVGDELTTVCEVLRSRTPVRRVGVLAGPLVADALAEGEPSGGIVGTLFPEVAEAVTEAIGGDRLRVYTTQDVIGVELSAAFVGLVALALGFAAAQKLGPSTLAVLGTRGLAEGARVAERFGASERTFAGLAGAGDVMAAIAGDKRPETAFGRPWPRASMPSKRPSAPVRTSRGPRSPAAFPTGPTATRSTCRSRPPSPS